MDENPAIDQLPDIAVDGAGRVWCAWWSDRGDSVGLWASYAMSTGVEEEAITQPERIELSVEPSIGRTFTFRVSNPGRIEEVVIYDACGRAVRYLETGDEGMVIWNGMDRFGSLLSAGVYLAALKKTPEIRKIILIR